MNRLSLTFALAALLAAGVAPAAPRKPAAPVPAQQTGPAVSLTAEGTHLLGNPQAPVKVVEYVSYTCPHCAHFHEESTGPLQAQYLSTGRASVEVRPFLRNAFDVNYIEQLQVPSGNTGLIVGNPGDPRTWGATVKLEF